MRRNSGVSHSVSIVVVLLMGLCFVGTVATEAWKVNPQELSDEAILKAKFLKTERIDVPTDAVTIRGPRFVLNARKDAYILLFTYYDYGIMSNDSEIHAINTRTGEATKFAPKGINFHGTVEAGKIDSRGRLFGMPPIKGIGQLWCYDSTENSFRNHGSPKFERGRSFVKSMIIHDDKLWCSVDSRGTVGLWHYDLKTEAFHSYGFIVPKRKLGGETHAYSMSGKGDYIYLAVGKVPWELYAFHVPTGKCEKILEAPAGNAQIWLSDDYAIRRPDPKDNAKMEMHELKDGKATLADKEWTWHKVSRRRAMASKEAGIGPHLPRPKLDVSAIRPTADGTSVIRYQLPGEKEWKTVTLKAKTYAQSIKRLAVLPDGLILGSRAPYQGNFLYDTKTGQSDRLGTIKLSQYATVVHDGKVYMSGYPNSPIYEYDPKLPWTAGGVKKPGKKTVRASDPSVNPRLLLQHTRSGAHKMWDAAVGSDGRVYFSGEAVRHGNGGAFGWWDPKAEEAGALAPKIFSGHKTKHCVAAFGGDQILLSSQTTINNTTGKRPDTAKIFIFDVKQGKITGEMAPIKGARRIGPLIGVSPGKIMGIADTPDRTDVVHSILFGVDLTTRTVAFQKRLLMNGERIFHQGLHGGQTFLLGPDGYVWTYMGTPYHPTLVRIHPQTAEITVLGRVKYVGPMAFVGKDLYFGATKPNRKLRRLANIVP